MGFSELCLLQHGYLQKYGERNGTPEYLRLPCPVQLRVKNDYVQAPGLTQEYYADQFKHRCLAMNPHTISHKRQTFKGADAYLSGDTHPKFAYGNEPGIDRRRRVRPFVYNDIAEFELGFSFTGVSIPMDKPSGGHLEPHHNTWRVSSPQNDDSMYFYAAQGMITSSMSFNHGGANHHHEHSWRDDGWQRHNHARVELLEYQVDTPVSAIRTFPVTGIPDFYAFLPGPEEVEGQQSPVRIMPYPSSCHI